MSNNEIELIDKNIKIKSFKEMSKFKIIEKNFSNWPRSHGGYASMRFSSLDNINKNNIKKLKLAWIYKSKDGGKGIQANPYLAYTYYLTSRVYIDQNNLQLSLEYLKKAYELSPNIESVRVLYFTVDNILKNKLNNN